MTIFAKVEYSLPMHILYVDNFLTPPIIDLYFIEKFFFFFFTLYSILEEDRKLMKIKKMK